MARLHFLRACTLLLAGALATTARAETFYTCVGFINSVPATITTQGTWCLRGDLATAITTGSAITIAANNVTIDCNGFKLGGLAGGTNTLAIGVTTTRLNATVRNCAIRGFNYGISLQGSGHLIEDNRIDTSRHTGIAVYGDDNLVRGNRVLDTGGRPGVAGIYGIYAEGDVLDNTVSAVFQDAEQGVFYGIYGATSGATIERNRVTGMYRMGAGGSAVGIRAGAPHMRIAGNHAVSRAAVSGVGIYGTVSPMHCVGNTASGFYTGINGCD